MPRLLHLILYAIFTLPLTSCYHKAEKPGDKISTGDEKSIAETVMPIKDTTDASILCIDSIQSLGTIVEEWQVKDQEFIKKQNTDAVIDVFLLSQEYHKDYRVLKTEIVNHTRDTISYSGSIFLSYKKSNHSWTPVKYPDIYSEPSILHLIPPGRRISLEFYLPHQDDYYKEKYRLQLRFRISSQSFYYIYKDFVLKPID